MNVQQISEAAGISEWQLYRRKKKPELWTKQELINLFSHLNLEIRREDDERKTESKLPQEHPTPFIGPRAEPRTIADFRSCKNSLFERGYPLDQTRDLVKQYFHCVKESILNVVDKNTLLITVPSGSGENKIPVLFALELASMTGAAVLPEGFISKLHKGESKLNLPLESRIHDPIRYNVHDPTRLKNIAANYHKVVLVDDLLNSGESSIRLRHALKRAGIKVHAIANLVNVDNRQPSPADIERVYKKISDLANLTMSDRLKLKSDMTEVFQEYTRQKLYVTERAIRDPRTALFAFKVICKAAALETTRTLSHEQNISL